MIEDERFAWLAGLYEGEGSIQAVPNSPTSVTVRLSIQMTDEDVLRYAMESVGCGALYGPYTRQKAHYKPIWHWVVSGDDAEALARRLAPYLFARRRAQIERALETKAESLAARVTPLDRFMRYVEVQHDGCWVWTSSRTSRIGPNGRRYGQFALRHDLPVQAHNWLYRQSHPEFPVGANLIQTCETSLCVVHWIPARKELRDGG